MVSPILGMTKLKLPQTPHQLFAGKKVLIFGIGLQGGGVGDTLALLKFGAHVRLTDKQPASKLAPSLAKLPSHLPRTLGTHRYEDIEWADIIIKNPGIPSDNEFIQYAYRLNKLVLGSAALFLYYTHATTIGITGTRGKSTTTILLYQILSSHFSNKVILGGNLPGHSSLALLLKKNYRFAVLELSSFQLADCHSLSISPRLAIVTNIYPDHLNRYSDMDSYINDKLSIVCYQSPSDHAVLNKYDPHMPVFASHTQAQTTYFTLSHLPTSLKGLHNKKNIAAATKAARILKVPPSTIKKVVASFKGLPYRQEVVAVKNDITFINDTTSTTPIALLTAISSLTQPTIMLVGGASKNLPFNQVVKKLATNPYVKHIVILGSKENKEFVSLLHKLCSHKIIGQAFSMQKAVDLALSKAKPGWAVVLSPGFASFDLFQNEFERGDQFNAVVNSL